MCLVVWVGVFSRARVTRLLFPSKFLELDLLLYSPLFKKHIEHANMPKSIFKGDTPLGNAANRRNIRREQVQGRTCTHRKASCTR
jgi:hypothetical protein